MMHNKKNSVNGYIPAGGKNSRMDTVNAGEISLYIFTSSVHRKDAIEGCKEIAERIKKEITIWGERTF